jgi:hypothetical protein
MIRTGLPTLCLGAFALIAPAAHAAPPDSDDGRFTFHRAGDGYLRLDGRTGHVSICARRPAGWLCQAIADDRAALEAEIARLQRANAALKKELLSHHLPLPSGVTPDAPASKPSSTRPKLPDDAEINRMMTFIEKMWRRLFEMIVSAQKELSGRT